MTDTVLSIQDLATQFHTDEGTVNAVDGISFDLHEGEVLGIVGESGSGKSVTALSIMNILDANGEIAHGDVKYREESLLEKSERELQNIRGDQIAMVFQDPMTSLNPVYTIGQQIGRVIRTHQNLSKSEIRERTLELLEQVGIPEPESRIDNYPHQFSGGMRQRALIAMAISCNPDILIADEPTTALDVTIEAQIFELLSDLQDEYGMSVILITHDLGVVAGTCDRVNVMYAGRIVERADVEELFENPRHPYTRGLMRSIPRMGIDTDRLTPIEGDVPDPISLPSGCSFRSRCPHATELCREYDPELREIEPNRQAACIHAEGYGPIPEPENQSDADQMISTDGGEE